MSCFFLLNMYIPPLLPTLQQEMFVTLPPIPKRHPQHAVTYNELLWKFSLYSIFTWSLWKITSPELPFCTQKLTNMYNSPFLSQILKLSVCGHATGSITLVFFFFFSFPPPSLFVLPERSQDSEVVLLSDSNSTQDAFTDPASSQDSSHKLASGKASSSSSESTTPVKDGQPASEDTGNQRLNEPFIASGTCWPVPP